MNAIAAYTPWIRIRMIVRIALVALTFGLIGAVGSRDAQAAVRFADGAYARSSVACKASSPNMLNMGTYANQSGIFHRLRIFVHYANSRNVNTWTPWSDFEALPSGFDFSPDTINALPDGSYTFQIQYAHKVAGVWRYFSEYIPSSSTTAAGRTCR